VLTVTGSDASTDTDDVTVTVAPPASQGGALALANPVASLSWPAEQTVRLFWYDGDTGDTLGVWSVGPGGWRRQATGVLAQTGWHDWDASSLSAGWYGLAVEAESASAWTVSYGPAALELLPASPPAPHAPLGIAQVSAVSSEAGAVSGEADVPRMRSRSRLSPLDRRAFASAHLPSAGDAIPPRLALRHGRLSETRPPRRSVPLHTDSHTPPTLSKDTWPVLPEWSSLAGDPFLWLVDES